MRYELRSVSIWAFVRVSFFLHLVVGFLVGIFYAAMLMMTVAVASSSPLDELSDLPLGLSAVGPLLMVILPIVLAVGGAVMGTLLGVVVVFAYNMIARVTGGIEFELGSIAPDPTGSVATLQPCHNSTLGSISPLPPPPPPRLKADPTGDAGTENQ